jgi:hypothetical protein
VRDWWRSNTVPLITTAPRFHGIYIALADGGEHEQDRLRATRPGGPN